MPTEQERAAQYRLDAQAREDARLANEKALAGDADAKVTLEANWSALLPWEGWDPIVKVHGEPK